MCRPTLLLLLLLTEANAKTLTSRALWVESLCLELGDRRS